MTHAIPHTPNLHVYQLPGFVHHSWLAISYDSYLEGYNTQQPSGQSVYLGQSGHFLQVTWVTGANHRKQDNPVYIFKMATVDSE